MPNSGSPIKNWKKLCPDIRLVKQSNFSINLERTSCSTPLDLLMDLVNAHGRLCASTRNHLLLPSLQTCHAFTGACICWRVHNIFWASTRSVVHASLPVCYASAPLHCVYVHTQHVRIKLRYMMYSSVHL